MTSLLAVLDPRKERTIRRCHVKISEKHPSQLTIWNGVKMRHAIQQSALITKYKIPINRHNAPSVLHTQFRPRHSITVSAAVNSTCNCCNNRRISLELFHIAIHATAGPNGRAV